VMAEDFGTYVRRKRKLANMTLAELARACRVSEGYMSKLEGGSKTPATDVVVRIAQALGEQPTRLLSKLGLTAPDTAEVTHRPTFEEFIRSDPNLTGAQKQQLISLYTLFAHGGTS
jgi:transcriptional regulator with XRE-family HTH domain